MRTITVAFHFGGPSLHVNPFVAARSLEIRLLGSLLRFHNFENSAVDISGGVLSLAMLAQELFSAKSVRESLYNSNHLDLVQAVLLRAATKGWCYFADLEANKWLRQDPEIYTVKNVSEETADAVCQKMRRLSFFKGAFEVSNDDKLHHVDFISSSLRRSTLFSRSEAGYWLDFDSDEDCGDSRRLLHGLGCTEVRRLDVFPTMEDTLLLAM